MTQYNGQKKKEKRTNNDLLNTTQKTSKMTPQKNRVSSDAL
jgi:hypothetical protein